MKSEDESLQMVKDREEEKLHFLESFLKSQQLVSILCL